MTGAIPGPALLFCPADRPDRYAKALAAADAVVLDLEDAVAPGAKAAARRVLVEHVVDPERVIVRVNGAATADQAADLDALRRTPYRRVMLPKAERVQDVEALSAWSVVALCETARGVLAAPSLAAAEPVVALMWGAEDLVVSLGGRSSRRAGGEYHDVARHARSSVLLAAGGCGRAAIDAVFLDTTDDDALRREASEAAAVGFALKACIHPRQVPLVREAFAPDAGRVAWARRVLEAAAQGGVTLVDGQMVDGPLVRQAERTLAVARPTSP